MTAHLVTLVLTLPGGTSAVLPCLPSDLRTRIAGRVVPESYGPYRAGGVVLRGRRLINNGHRRASVRVWCG